MAEQNKPTPEHFDEEIIRGKHIDEYKENKPALREKIHKLVYSWAESYCDSGCRCISGCKGCNFIEEIAKPRTNEILNLLKEELDKLTVIGDEEIREALKKAVDEAQHYGDDGNPLPEREVALASHNHTINQLKGLLG